MRAFSHSAGDTDANEVAGDKGEESHPVGAQNQSGLLASSAVPLVEGPIPTPCFPGSNGVGPDAFFMGETSGGLAGREGHGGAEQCLGSAPSGRTHTGFAPSPLLPDCCLSKTALDEDHGANSDADAVHVGNGHFAGGFVVCPDTLLMMPQGLTEPALEDMDKNGVAAADWLEVTHALLDEGT